jgi:hypothetical protein
MQIEQQKKKRKKEKKKNKEIFVRTDDSRSRGSGIGVDPWLRKFQDESLLESVVNRRCRLARTSLGGREKPDPKLELPGERGL